MKKWIKAIKFALSFCALTYIGGNMFALGAYNAANLVGVIVVIDESGWTSNAGGE